MARVRCKGLVRSERIDGYENSVLGRATSVDLITNNQIWSATLVQRFLTVLSDDVIIARILWSSHQISYNNEVNEGKLYVKISLIYINYGHSVERLHCRLYNCSSKYI